MNKSIITLILVSFSIFVQAQTINSSQLVGEWTVTSGKVSSTNLQDEAKQMMNMMINGFTDSKWTFHQNGTFNIELKDGLPPFMEELKFLNNKLWKIDDKKQQIRIGTKEDNYNHLVLITKQNKSPLTVFFSDTPISLILTKK